MAMFELQILRFFSQHSWYKVDQKRENIFISGQTYFFAFYYVIYSRLNFEKMKLSRIPEALWWLRFTRKAPRLMITIIRPKFIFSIDSWDPPKNAVLRSWQVLTFYKIIVGNRPEEIHFRGPFGDKRSQSGAKEQYKENWK